MNVNLKNLGTVNKNKVTLSTEKGYIILYFSYETIVGYNVRNESYSVMRVRKNDWGTTTGKLLNDLEPDKTKRLDGEKFNILLQEDMRTIGL